MVDETKLWAKVPHQDCDAFMTSRRLAGVKRSPAAVAAAEGAKVKGEAGDGDAAQWHKLEGPGLSPSGSLPDDEAPDVDGPDGPDDDYEGYYDR